MITKIIQIGNSKGIRIPSQVLQELKIENQVELIVGEKKDEIKKTRPCLIISPDEMNRNIQTVIIAPMTTKSHRYPTRVQTLLQNKKGWIVLDQIRTIDNQRLIKKIGKINDKTIKEVKSVIKEMLVD